MKKKRTEKKQKNKQKTKNRKEKKRKYRKTDRPTNGKDEAFGNKNQKRDIKKEKSD